MADRGIALEGATIVVRGSFNPAIFSPSWFRDQALIGATEYKAQQIEIITRDLAVFTLGWLTCHVTQDGLQLYTTEPEEFERLKDAGLGVLRLLEHTPISALGINRDYHVTLDSREELHAIGDALAPKDVWADSLKLAGMRTLTIWGARTDAYSGHVQVNVEPSTRFPQSVYIATNDHFDLSLAADEPATRDTAWNFEAAVSEPSAAKGKVAIQVLLEEWKTSFQRSEDIRLTVLKSAGAA